MKFLTTCCWSNSSSICFATCASQHHMETTVKALCLTYSVSMLCLCWSWQRSHQCTLYTHTHWACSIPFNSRHSSKIQYMYFPLALPLSGLQNSVSSAKFSSFIKCKQSCRIGWKKKDCLCLSSWNAKHTCTRSWENMSQGHHTKYRNFTNYHSFNQKWEKSHEITGCGVGSDIKKTAEFWAS